MSNPKLLKLLNTLKHKKSLQERENMLVVMEGIQEINHFKAHLLEEQDKEGYLEQIAKKLQYEQFPKGTIVFHKDQHGKKIYFQLSGEIQLWKPKQDVNINKEIQINSEINRLDQEIQKLQESSGNIDITSDYYYESVFYKDLVKKKEYQYQLLSRITDKVSEQQLYENGNLDYFPRGKICKFTKSQTLKQGDIFGEINFNADKVRNYTAFSSQDTQVCSILIEDYLKIFHLEYHQMIYSYNLLQKLFPEAKIDSLIKLAQKFKQQAQIYQQAIFQQGDISKYIYIIKQGQVKLLKYDKNNQKNNNGLQNIGILGQDQILGHEDLNSYTCSYTAICDSNDTIIYYIQKDFLLETLNYTEDNIFQNQINDLSKTHSSFLTERGSQIQNCQYQITQKEIDEERKKIMNSKSSTSKIDMETYNSININQKKKKLSKIKQQDYILMSNMEKQHKKSNSLNIQNPQQNKQKFRNFKNIFNFQESTQNLLNIANNMKLQKGSLTSQELYIKSKIIKAKEDQNVSKMLQKQAQKNPKIQKLLDKHYNSHKNIEMQQLLILEKNQKMYQNIENPEDSEDYLETQNDTLQLEEEKTQNIIYPQTAYNSPIQQNQGSQFQMFASPNFNAFQNVNFNNFCQQQDHDSQEFQSPEILKPESKFLIQSSLIGSGSLGKKSKSQDILSPENVNRINQLLSNNNTPKFKNFMDQNENENGQTKFNYNSKLCQQMVSPPQSPTVNKQRKNPSFNNSFSKKIQSQKWKFQQQQQLSRKQKFTSSQYVSQFNMNDDKDKDQFLLTNSKKNSGSFIFNITNKNKEITDSNNKGEQYSNNKYCKSSVKLPKSINLNYKSMGLQLKTKGQKDSVDNSNSKDNNSLLSNQNLTGKQFLLSKPKIKLQSSVIKDNFRIQTRKISKVQLEDQDQQQQ